MLLMFSKLFLECRAAYIFASFLLVAAYFAYNLCFLLLLPLLHIWLLIVTVTFHPSPFSKALRITSHVRPAEVHMHTRKDVIKFMLFHFILFGR